MVNLKNIFNPWPNRGVFVCGPVVSKLTLRFQCSFFVRKLLILCSMVLSYEYICCSCFHLWWYALSPFWRDLRLEHLQLHLSNITFKLQLEHLDLLKEFRFYLVLASILQRLITSIGWTGSRSGSYNKGYFLNKLVHMFCC